MKKLRIISLILALITIISAFAGCANKEKDDGPEATKKPLEEVKLSVLSGATGFGAAKLIGDAKDSKTLNKYVITIESSPKVIQDALIAGEIDAAALPTNKAALIANSKENSIKVIAITTGGVMHFISNEEEVTDIKDVKGKKIGIPLEPSYILSALLAQVFPDEADRNTIEVVTYATPSDLVTAIVKGEVTNAVLPEPLLTTVMSKKDTLKKGFDLSSEWNKYFKTSELWQGCIVARTDWAESHEAEIKNMLSDLENSINFVKENNEEAGALIETYFGVTAPVAEKALKNTSLVFESGAKMKSLLEKLYEVLVTIPESSIGGKVPAESFYY